MTKREQIMRLAEFDGEALKAHWLNVPSQDDYESAKFENARLKPLITAMAERIETLEAALGRYKYITVYCLDRQREFNFAHEALSTKGSLEELLEKGGEG